MYIYLCDLIQNSPNQTSNAQLKRTPKKKKEAFLASLINVKASYQCTNQRSQKKKNHNSTEQKFLFFNHARSFKNSPLARSRCRASLPTEIPRFKIKIKKK